MTRTNKWTVHEKKATPHYFTHNGHYGADPTKVKKNGFGKGNWGVAGDEINDMINAGEIQGFKARRGSNSSMNEQRYAKVQTDGWIDEDSDEE